MLEFWEIEDDPDLGFVIVDREFELWLIAALGISFEDISYAAVGEDDEQEIELIMDYGDFMNLQDLYEEYTIYGWSLLTDDKDVIEDWQVTFALRAEDKPICPHCGVRLNFSQNRPQKNTRRPAQVIGVGALLFLGILMLRKK